MGIEVVRTGGGGAGSPGPAGAAGGAGSPGLEGEEGPPGPPGPPGSAGADGSPGSQGAPGPPGPAGDEGEAGLPGTPGPAGSAGADGAPGPAGPQAFAFIAGEEGEAGLPGFPGPAGPAGADGAVGPAGPQAFAFIAGEEGESGSSGPPGPAGSGGGPSRLAMTFLGPYNTNAAWMNMPAALTEFLGINNTRRWVDLTGYTQCRIGRRTAVAGFAGAELLLQYQTVDGGAFTELAATAGAGDLLIDTGASTVVTAWFDIASAAQASVILSLWGQGGNATADPSFGNVFAEFRP